MRKMQKEIQRWTPDIVLPQLLVHLVVMRTFVNLTKMQRKNIISTLNVKL
jgi:hypothetical protein